MYRAAGSPSDSSPQTASTPQTAARTHLRRAQHLELLVGVAALGLKVVHQAGQQLLVLGHILEGGGGVRKCVRCCEPGPLSDRGKP